MTDALKLIHWPSLQVYSFFFCGICRPHLWAVIQIETVTEYRKITNTKAQKFPRHTDTKPIEIPLMVIKGFTLFCVPELKKNIKWENAVSTYRINCFT